MRGCGFGEEGKDGEGGVERGWGVGLVVKWMVFDFGFVVGLRKRKKKGFGGWGWDWVGWSGIGCFGGW